MRSKWKGNFISKEILSYYSSKNLDKANVFSSDVVILKEFIGLNINVHNGLNFYPLTISASMVGKKLGEFVFTKKTGTLIHKNQLKKQESRSRK